MVSVSFSFFFFFCNGVYCHQASLHRGSAWTARPFKIPKTFFPICICGSRIEILFFQHRGSIMYVLSVSCRAVSCSFHYICYRALTIYIWFAHIRLPLWFVKLSDSPTFSANTFIKFSSLSKPIFLCEKRIFASVEHIEWPLFLLLSDKHHRNQ